MGTTEKPAILAAKMAEGKWGFCGRLPIALTVPFILRRLPEQRGLLGLPFHATIFRAIRFLAISSLLLPAFYVTSQLSRCS
ncbi:MAG: hypothetical protein ACLRSW_05400 [Christensenellaceae bacterium]